MGGDAIGETVDAEFEAGVIAFRRSALQGIAPVRRLLAGVEQPGEASEIGVSDVLAGGPPLVGRLHRACPVLPHASALLATQCVSGSDLRVGGSS